jgi:hypothetical protein
MPVRLVIDRFENGRAVLESLDTGETRSVDAAALPPGAREGDVLESGGTGFRIDMETTARRKEKMQKKLNELWD